MNPREQSHRQRLSQQSYQSQPHDTLSNGSRHSQAIPASSASDLQDILLTPDLGQDHTTTIPMASAATQQAAFMPTRFHDLSALYPQHISTSRPTEDKSVAHHFPYDAYQQSNYLGFAHNFDNVNVQSWQQQQQARQMQYSPSERQTNDLLDDYQSGSLSGSRTSLHQQSIQQQQRQQLQVSTFYGQQSPTQYQSPQSDYMLSAPHHVHHHTMPQASPVFNRSGEPSERSSRERDSGSAPNLVGQDGMPEPAPRPKGPKLKFTPADDALLVELKEEKGLTWKQIADFFPGRSSGTLQVRYCTKLKAKTTVWTDEMVQKLKHAMAEYDNDRWRIIASKVGNGFSATACHDRAIELEVEETGDLVVGDLEQEDESD